jgi:hypothetical protein
MGSFRAKKNATKVARDLQQKGYPSVVSGERVQNKGYWYRIYVGPISSLSLAKLQSSKLKKRGLTKYTAIYKKSLIQDDSEKTVRTAKKAAPIAAATAGIKRSQPSTTAPPVAKKPPTVQSGKQGVAAAKKAPPTVSPTEERPKEIIEFQRRGYGRNIAAGKLSFSLRQTYREVNTELTDRTLIESDGTTTTKQNVPISSSEKNDFDTDMSLTMLRVGLGLTDFLEVYGEIGACYDDFEDFNLAYGGGVRLNLLEVKTGSLRGFYTARATGFPKTPTGGTLPVKERSALPGIGLPFMLGGPISSMMKIPTANSWKTFRLASPRSNSKMTSRRKITLVPTVASVST